MTTEASHLAEVNVQDGSAADSPVTVIGLGLMGQALAGALLRTGHPTTVWNRTAAKAEQLVAEGAALADSAREAVAASPLAIICLSNYQAVHDVLDPIGDVLAGRVVVNLTSGTSRAARETAEWAARRGAAYLDGAIGAVPESMGTDEAIVTYSGQQSVFDTCEPTLRHLAGATTYLGADHGLASLYEAALLSVMWSTLNGFLQGAALLETAGVEASTFAAFAGSGIGTVTGWLVGYAQQIDDGDYRALDATLDTQRSAMEHLVGESEALGVNAELPKLVRALADRAIAAGHRGAGYPAMIEVFRGADGGR